jgi:biopolymer transport protein ExbB/TolQ
MTPPQTSPAGERAARPRRTLTTVAAFAVGLPLAAGFLALVYYGPLRDTPLARYLKHNVECAEVVMFCCAVSALGAKLCGHFGERRACGRAVLPPWAGRPVPVAEAPGLLAALGRLPRSLQNTYLVNRVGAVLDFLARRGSAADLDDHLRDLADADAVALENSYSLVRFITWAIPILGFLGTVLGITGAISGVTPERLEHDLNSVTDGLALAFDATALALGLTMVTMFLSYVVDRLEQSVLEAVDRHVIRHLAHRFERTDGEGSQVIEAVRQNSTVLLRATEALVQRQAEVWAKSVEAVDRRRAEAEAGIQERLTAALAAALERTLESHNRRLAALEAQAVQQGNQLMGQLAAVAAAVREQQAALGRTADGIAAQAAALAHLQEGEKQLVRLQEVLAHNLEALAGAGSFEQAVHSLTAAVHLLTARAAAPAGAGAGQRRPGVAA